MNTISLALTYGLMSLATLWACAGGDYKLFWERQLALAVVLLVNGLLLTWMHKRLRVLRLNRGSLMMGISTGLGTAIPFIFLIYLVKSGYIFASQYEVLKEAAPQGLAHILVASFVLVPAFELILRSLLQPAWGIGNVAFLDALNFGFGLQMFTPFVVIWAMGAVWGLIARHFGFTTALISRSVWTFLVLTTLFAL